MKIGDKVTVLFPEHSEIRFLRCRVAKFLGNKVQLYDPVKDWSWGADLDAARVIRSDWFIKGDKVYVRPWWVPNYTSIGG